MKFIIYCRKSTDTEDKQLLSLESQEHELMQVADSQGLNIVKVLTESMSAKAPGRPIFNEMIAMIMSGQADAILCWKIDRLTRNPVDGGQLQWLLQKGNIQCIQTYEKTYLPHDNVLIMGIEQAMANQYIRELSANVKRGNRTKLEKGDWPGPAPYGYLNDRINKTIVPDPVLAPYVKQIFTLYATGSYSFKDIATTLYEKGLRTKKGNKVFKSQIQKILTRPFYMGIMERDGKVYPGNHEPIVTKKLYDTAQQVMQNNSRPRPSKHFFPIRGYLSCNMCGCALTATVKKGHHYYYCTNGKGHCDQHKSYIREKDIYKIVADTFEQVKFSERKIELMYRAAKEKAESESSDKQFFVTNIERLLQALDKKERLLLDTLLAEQITKDLYQEKVNEIKKERIDLKRQLKDAEKDSGLLTLEPIKNVFLEANRAKSEFLEASDEEKRKIVEKLLWNLLIEDKNVAQTKFKPAFQAMAIAPKNGDISQMLPDRDSNPD
jgi:site-specific DNA recombinase